LIPTRFRDNPEVIPRECRDHPELIPAKFGIGRDRSL
jgi:hypothetical protein